MTGRVFAARWATEEEQRRHATSANGVVEDVTFNPSQIVCFACPMAMAQRISFALNFAARFDLKELKNLSAAVTSQMREKSDG